jgi:NAD(P)-dependent dehydrogenase (short-subunit alcohol dehydrogenase family)
VESVLITGCSSGFGLLAAIELARQGRQVFATMRDLSKRRTLDIAATKAGVTLEVLQLDVCDQASIDRVVGQVLEATGGGLGSVVHNAGIATAGFFEDLEDQQVRQVFETNFFGVLALTRAVLPTMREQRRGRVVVVSSSSAFVPEPALSAYAASKRAVEGWAESVAVEVAPFGIDVVLLEPGTYKTEIWDSATVAKPEGSVYREFVEVMEPKIRVNVEQNGRDPQEVADRIAAVVAARNPAFRSSIGTSSHVMRAMSHLLPFRARRRMLSRATGIDRVSP